MKMLLEVNESSSTLQLSLGLVLYRLVLYQDSRVGNVCVCVCGGGGGVQGPF